MERTYTHHELSEVAEELLKNSVEKIFLFYGEMGVGKTTLIKEIVKLLGVNEISSSPSFSIVNEYEGTNETIYHFDFYRVENIAEAYDIGAEEYLYSGNFIFMEWPEKIKEILPEHSNKIIIKTNPNGSRTLNLCK